MKIKKLFGVNKPIIGMIHLDYLVGQPKFKGLKAVIDKALKDLRALESGGVDAVLVENWQDNTFGPFVGSEVIACMTVITKAIIENTSLPVGVNVLPNDYKAAFAIAKVCGAKFVQVDVFVNKVLTHYSYSDAKPFRVEVNLTEFKEYRKKIGASNILLFATIHPKHYKLLEKKSIEQSAYEAVVNGADVVVVTGDATGNAPSIDKIKQCKATITAPVFIGSGLNKNNAAQLLKYADGAIVGTAFKSSDFKEVIEQNVKDIMTIIKSIRK